MEKPVIILGGGTWGSLLAYRLKTALPSVPFKLYSENSLLGPAESLTFLESDVGACQWLHPFVSQSWKEHQISTLSFDRWHQGKIHYISQNKFNDVMMKSLSGSVFHDPSLSLELAQEMGSFVIDTRTQCHYRKKGFKKYLGLEVELTSEHHLIAPVIFDNVVDKKECSRYISYYPTGTRTLFIKDHCYSVNESSELDKMRNDLLVLLKERNWKISRVLKVENEMSTIPLTTPVMQQQNRVINLSGIFHGTTGSSLPQAVRLIDQLVQTSFRLGEVKEVVKSFKKQEEKYQDFFRHLNHQILVDKNPEVFEAIFCQPQKTIERFYRGNLSLMDRSRVSVGKTTQQMKGLMQMVLPYSLHSRVGYAREKTV